MATTDRTAPARPGLGDREPGRARRGGRRAEWWRGWFAPAQGLRPRPLDVLVALVIAFVQVAGTIAYSQDEPPSPWAFDALACIPLLAGPVALLFRRRWPEATLVVTFAAAAGYAASGYPRGPAGFPAFGFAVASAIMMGRSSFAWRMLVVAYAAFIWLPSLIPDEVEKARGLAGAAANLAWLPLVGAASEIARSRLERRAERAQWRGEEARRRASEERLRIARELHDVLAHNISLINVQAGVALHLLDERPEQARPALTAIKEASKEALGELRSVLDVLRRGRRGGAARARGVGAPRPTAGLRDLDGLVRRTRAAGLDVPVAVAGRGPAAARRASTWPRSGSCRRRSPTSSATPAPAPGHGPPRRTRRPSWSCEVDDDGRGAGAAAGARDGRRAAASPACGSGPRPGRHARGRPPARRRLPGPGHAARWPRTAGE